MTYEDHLSRLEGILQQFRQYNLKCTLHKCVFFSTSVRFTGYVLHNGTIATDPAKTQAIDGLDPSRGVQDLPQFLGFVMYYGRHYIWHLSAKLKPLRDLLVQRNPWIWRERELVTCNEHHL
jgi:hypothetical protein